MASNHQIEANRANAYNSTGPRTPKGKKNASRNAVQHGLYSSYPVVTSESEGDYEKLLDAYFERFAPATPEESFLVDLLATSEFLTRRYVFADADIYNRDFEGYNKPSIGVTMMREPKTIALADRRINSAQRNYSRALRSLMALRRTRGEDPLPPAKIRDANKDVNPELGSFLHFSSDAESPSDEPDDLPLAA